MAGIAGVLGGEKPLLSLLLLTLETLHRGWGLVGLAVALSRKNGTSIASKRYTEGSWYPVFASLLRKTVDSAESTGSRIAGGIGFVGESPLGGQPAVVRENGVELAVAFDGRILNRRLIAKSVGIEEGESEAETVARALARLYREHGRDIVEASRALVESAIGGFSMVVITSEPRLVAARDVQGFKPLSYSFSDSSLAIASESSALRVLGLEWRELSPGSVLSFDGSSLETATAGGLGEPTPCVFEYVYISRPDSVFNGVTVYLAKFNMGREVARVARADADIVVPLPESGKIAALGYSRESGIPLEEAIYVSRYVGRSFLAPKTIRSLIADAKYGIIEKLVEEKRIVLVDDSIVRGTTMRRIVRRLKQAGAREVHVRIASPRFRHSCPIIEDVSHKELAARSHSLFEKEIEADSLEHNRVDGLARAIGLPSLCTACFTGQCPLRRGGEFWRGEE